MLLKLSARALRATGATSEENFVGRISERLDLPEAARAREILLLRYPVEALPGGFRGYLTLGEHVEYPNRDSYLLSDEFRYLAEGDVVRIEPTRGRIHALYRRNSPSNTFLVTERCDNYCVMCSQPPKSHDDRWIVDELKGVIPLVSPDTKEIGITGGEPTLLGAELVELLDRMRVFLPRTAVHILSNGRNFNDSELARSVASVKHPDLMIGIPLYSDVSYEHDYIVQARGAFEETIQGILNLKRHGVKVEIRFVIHRGTVQSLSSFASFVTRNLLFVDHVALMGLEQMGFARSNLDEIWIDPLDYQRELALAATTLDRAGITVSIYNHQLCVLDRKLHHFARASISDWKNAFVEECSNCVLRGRCGGFFASSTETKSRGIRPIVV